MKGEPVMATYNVRKINESESFERHLALLASKGRIKAAPTEDKSTNSGNKRVPRTRNQFEEGRNPSVWYETQEGKWTRGI